MEIRKINNRVWKFIDDEIGEFSPSKFTINELNNTITIVYFNNLRSKTYSASDVDVYDVGATSPFNTSSGIDLMTELEALNCPCFQKDETTINNYGGATAFTDLTDVPSSYIGQANKVVSVKADESGLEFTTTSDGSQLDVLQLNDSVSVSYAIDFNIDTHRLTLTGNTTFTESNLPGAGFTKTITLHIKGNFGLIFPTAWNTYISGEYDGTASLNTIVVETIGTERKVQISQPD